MKGKSKVLAFFLFFFIFVANVFTQDSLELEAKYLERASLAYNNNNLVGAYKNINACMKIACNRDKVLDSKLVIYGKTIYREYIKSLRDTLTEEELIDIKYNLDQFPALQDYSINKLVEQTEARMRARENDADKKLREQFINNIKGNSDSTKKAIQEIVIQNKKNSDYLIEQGERSKEQQKKFEEKFDQIIVLIFVIFVLILIVVTIIVLTIKFAQVVYKREQEQYKETIKILSDNNNQAQIAMFESLNHLSGLNIKLSYSSKWSQRELEDEGPETKSEIRELAAKCEDLGSRIDQVTGRKNNSKNVSELVYKIAIRLGVNQKEALVYFCAAMVYDAGFLNVDPDIMNSSELTEEERKLVNRHVDMTASLLDFVPKRYWNIFLNGAKYHHENIDGSGFPEGLKGDEIPKIARIIRVADSYNALLSKRSYRSGTDKDSAIDVLALESGLYDNEVINALRDII